MFVQDFHELILYELVLGVGASLVSGADISILYDSVDKTYRRQSTQSLANMQLCSGSGESIAAILGGLLVTFSFHHALIANAVAAWIPVFVALALVEPTYQKMSNVSHLKNLQQVMRHLFLNPDRMVLLIFLNLVIWGLSTFIAVWIFQKYWEENGIPLIYFGVLWALYNISVGLVGKQVHRLEHKWGPIPLLIFLGLAPITGYLGMALTTGYIGVALGILFYFSRGVNHVLLKDALNWRTPSSFRATANSIQSFFFRLGFALVGPGVGLLIDSHGIRFTLLTLGSVFAILYLVALTPLISLIRKTAPSYIPDQ